MHAVPSHLPTVSHKGTGKVSVGHPIARLLFGPQEEAPTNATAGEGGSDADRHRGGWGRGGLNKGGKLVSVGVSHTPVSIAGGLDGWVLHAKCDRCVKDDP